MAFRVRVTPLIESDRKRYHDRRQWSSRPLDLGGPHPLQFVLRPRSPLLIGRGIARFGPTHDAEHASVDVATRATLAQASVFLGVHRARAMSVIWGTAGVREPLVSGTVGVRSVFGHPDTNRPCLSCARRFDNTDARSSRGSGPVIQGVRPSFIQGVIQGVRPSFKLF